MRTDFDPNAQMLSLEKDQNTIYVMVESNRRHENTYLVAIGKFSFYSKYISRNL